MLKDAQRRRFDVVMAWAIDRLGRSLIDLLGTIQVFGSMRRRSVPGSAGARHDNASWKAHVSNHGRLCPVRAQHDPSTSLKRAVEAGKQLGRPRRIDPALEKRIQSQLQAGKGMLTIAIELGVGSGTVQRIKREMEEGRLSTAPRPPLSAITPIERR